MDAMLFSSRSGGLIHRRKVNVTEYDNGQISIKVIAYDNIIAILLEGVKSLSDEVKELKNKIEK